MLLRVARELRKETEQLGITARQATLLWLVKRSPGLSLAELAADEGISPPAMCGHVDRLERSGLIERVPAESLRAFYRKYYRPDNAMLVIAGQFDPAKALELAAKDFGAIPKPDRALPATYTEEPAQDGEREVNVRRVGNLRLVAAAYHVPAVAHADNAPLSVLANVLGHTPGGRLHKALVEGKLAAGSGANSESMRDPGLLTAVAVIPNDGDAQKTEAELLKQLERIAAQRRIVLCAHDFEVHDQPWLCARRSTSVELVFYDSKAPAEPVAGAAPPSGSRAAPRTGEE